MSIIVSPALAYLVQGTRTSPTTVAELQRVLLAVAIALCAAWVKWKFDARRNAKRDSGKTRRKP